MLILLWIVLGFTLMNFIVVCLAYTLLMEFRQFLELWMRLGNRGQHGS